MDEQQKQAFNLAVDLYTDLLFEQKELIFRIIETSYSKGYETARQQIQQELQDQLQQQHVPEQHVEEKPKATNIVR